jgi:hypothetical protein
MSDGPKDAALEGCKDGLKEVVQRLTSVVLVDWALTDTAAKHDECAQRFRDTLQRYKQGYDRLLKTVDDVYA